MIRSLAPDVPSLKAGFGLATASQWPRLGQTGRAVWGDVQGSGKDPYRSVIDLRDVAFRCSCPSRKFPCKHGIGLMLLVAREPTLFADTTEPDWVSDWLDKRTAKLAEPAPPADQVSTDEPANARKAADRQKRAVGRLDTLRAGAAELTRWLDDLTRTGLLTMPDKGAEFWERTAARMIDAKAPGLATRVRQLGSLSFFDGTAWQAEALRQAGLLHLLLAAFDRIDQLPPDLQADVRTQIGLTMTQKELLDAPDTDRLTDTFWVVARLTTQQDDLTIQRNYLLGRESGRFALVLNFAYKTLPIDLTLIPGTRLPATLVFYPGRWPLRAVVATRKMPESGPDTDASGWTNADWPTAQTALARVLARSPWVEEVPQVVDALTLAVDQGRYFLRDRTGAVQPLDPHWPDAARYRWLALTGGQPATVCLLRHPTHVEPLGLWLDDQYRLLA